MYGFRPVGSKHTLKPPSFFTRDTKLLSHSGTSLGLSFLNTALCSKLSLNFCLMAIGTLLQGLLQGLAPSLRSILIGSTFSLPRPVNTSLHSLSIWSLVSPGTLDSIVPT